MTAPRIQPGAFALAVPPVDDVSQLSRQERRRINRKLDAGKAPPPEFGIRLNFDRIAEYLSELASVDEADGGAP